MMNGHHSQCANRFIFLSAMTLDDYKKSNMYSDSKLAALLYARGLAEQVSASNYPLYVNIASPGLVATNLARHDKYRWLKFIMGAPIFLLFLRTPRQGSQTILECAMANNLSSNGMFYRLCKPTKFDNVANDSNLIERVCSLTKRAIGI